MSILKRLFVIWVVFAFTIPCEDVRAQFTVPELVGRPTDKFVCVNVIADTEMELYCEYGIAPGVYGNQTPVSAAHANTPIEVPIGNLQPDTQYYYRIRYRKPGENQFLARDEYSFHTQRPAGSTFTFCVQGDSHPERLNRMYHPDLYIRTMNNVLQDHPDFYFTIGDDFSIEKLINRNRLSRKSVDDVYLNQRNILGLIGSSIPLFLVNGNHEQAARYLLDGTPDNAAILAAKSRTAIFPLPAPDSFYSGNSEAIEFVGLLRDYYAFEWGDALFVVIDPYWHSPVPVDNVAGGGPKRKDIWDVTIGDVQYNWLKQTLEESGAAYRFIFSHHVLGTGRGGVEAAGLYEWGGFGRQGDWEFEDRRPGWALPIHQLMAANNVSIFFQGHDHLFAHQELDGVVYQSLPNPADPTYTAFNATVYKSGTVLPNSGHVRVTVSASGAVVDYVRSFLPKDETDDLQNRSVSHSYTVAQADTEN